jgi:hypothetical protein
MSFCRVAATLKRWSGKMLELVTVVVVFGKSVYLHLT